MLEHYAHLAHFLYQTGEVTGRKKFQKMVYLTKRLGYPFPEPFTYYYYGPYSERLSTEIGEMVFYGLVDEAVIELRGFKTYRYRLTEKGEQLVSGDQTHVVAIIEAGQAFSRAGQTLAEMNRHDSRFLELAATLDYLLEDGLSDAEARSKVIALKAEQHYKTEELDQALSFLVELKQRAGCPATDA